MSTARTNSENVRWSGIQKAIGSVDDAIGDALEHAIKVKHRRRLTKTGWADALDAPTDEDGWTRRTPVHEGNEVEVLIDGATAIPAMVQAIEQARSHVYLAGWHSTPDFPVRRPEGAPASGGAHHSLETGDSVLTVGQHTNDGSGLGEETLRDLLARTAERVPVRMLLWGGPPVPVFHPSRKDARRARDGFDADSKIICALDTREYTMHCHHEKLVIVDDEIAFVGGIDLTDLAGDRYDDSTHNRVDDLGWHDVATRLRGPVVGAVVEHFRARWAETTQESLPAARPQEPHPGGIPAQLVRTVPERTYDFLPEGEFTNLAAYLGALRSAEHLIYVENQFLWSPEVVEVLMDKLQRPPHPDFRLVLVLPLRPDSGKDTTSGQLAQLIQAAGDGPHLLATTLIGPTADSAGVYVHAKVGIVDDRWMIIGSANLNEHSLLNDTEVGVVVQDEALIRDTRLRLWAEHLRRPTARVSGSPSEVVDGVWVPTCDEQDAISAAGLDPVHRVRRISGLTARTNRLEGPLRSLFVDG